MTLDRSRHGNVGVDVPVGLEDVLFVLGCRDAKGNQECGDVD